MVKAGGKMADSGSVLFNFQRQGEIYIKGNASREEEVILLVQMAFEVTLCLRLALQFMSS